MTDMTITIIITFIITIIATVIIVVAVTALRRCSHNKETPSTDEPCSLAAPQLPSC